MNERKIEYQAFCDWCNENPQFDLDPRLHTCAGPLGDGGYISNRATMMAFAAFRAGVKYEAGKNEQ